MTSIEGLAPYRPNPRRRDPARWWIARGTLQEGRLCLDTLAEQEDAPASVGTAGLAAPCSLPAAFLDHLGLPPTRPAQLEALSARTLPRLLSDARAFASRRRHGTKHPRRWAGESVAAMDRARLALFHAALPVLRATRTLPWDAPEPPFAVEVDVDAFLAASGTKGSTARGERPEAVRRREAILEHLANAVPALLLDTRERNLALSSAGALDAVIAAAAAAWFETNRPTPPGPASEAWVPLPSST